MLVVMDTKNALIISGTGDVVEPDDQILAIGSGGAFALAAARALKATSDLSTEKMVRKSLEIAADICIYTNSNVIVEAIKK
jgi:ATP-dependent HslUV protease subunit HslV